ncbi:DUF3445 domain-containing protein [Fretibacter rubidus]|uniref:heme-dependent oxidative N-demethylase family protein n=1 Tax=Fretibacter rubidus TaxID=570162 RepID=UPI00352BA688
MTLAVPDHFKSILNERLSVQPWMDAQLSRLPGVKPLGDTSWLIRDAVFEQQMAYRDYLLETHRACVFQTLAGHEDVFEEVRDIVIADCGFGLHGSDISRPDGIHINKDADHPLVIAGRLTQLDLCVLADIEGIYRVIGAVLCFPSSWTLSQKIGRSLGDIHSPVDEYNAAIDKSVNRMLRAVTVNRPLWRANNLIYTDPDLHQPRPEGVAKPIHPTAPRFVRVERQSFVRLPKTGAVIFGIHTSIVPAQTLTKESHSALAAIKPNVKPKP